MKQVGAVFVLVVLAVVTVSCERLAGLHNTNMRISGEWQKIEMSFPGDDVYDFSERVISVNGIEQGSYRFESNTMLEVTMYGSVTVYEVEFVNDSKMVWYLKTSKGRDRIYDWVKAK